MTLIKNRIQDSFKSINHKGIYCKFDFLKIKLQLFKGHHRVKGKLQKKFISKVLEPGELKKTTQREGKYY